MAEEKAARDLLDVLLGPFRAYCVYAAAKLGVVDGLRDGPRTAAELASRTGTHPEALVRLLRMLGTLGVTEGDGHGRHRLGPSGELLRSDRDDSMRGLVLCYGEQFYPPFRHIVHSMRTGEQSFGEAFGAPLFDYYSRNPEAGRVFDDAMVAGGTMVFRSVPSAFDFSAARHVVDVAGGNGTLLATILHAHPQLRGTLAEVPRLLEPARELLRTREVGERCTVTVSDVFTAVPPGADVYLLSRVLHDWDDERCRAILRTVRAAMDPGASLLVLERILPAADEPSLAVDFDLHMLVTTGGRERNFADYDDLFARTGFVRRTTAPLPVGFRLLVATAE